MTWHEDVSIAVSPSDAPMTVSEQFERTVPLRSEQDDYLALQVAQPLPGVCTRPGRQADEQRSITIRFRPGWFGREQVSLGSFLRAALWVIVTFGYANRRVLNVSATVAGTWPLCNRCRWSAVALRWVGHICALFGPLALFVIFAGRQSGVSGELFDQLRLVVAPGWFPLGLMVAAAAHLRSITFVRCRPIEDDAPTTVTVRVHPAFAAAVPDGDADGRTGTDSAEENDRHGSR